MDIKDIAHTFQNLFDIQYDFVLGKKGKKTEISIIFRDSDFHHLAGLQYLDDVNSLKRSRDLVFWDIYNGVIPATEIVNSDSYLKIIKRLESLRQIEKLIDTNQIVFRYAPKDNPASKIESDFLLQSHFDNGEKVFVFLKYTNKQNKVFCNSIFPLNKYDYTEYQTKLTLLKKTKIRISTGEILDSYISKSYRTNL